MKKLKTLTYQHTLAACCLGNVVLTIINFLQPLLFVIFMEQFGLTLGMISGLVMVNFGVQSLTDLLAAKYLDKIGYRRGAVASSLLCLISLVCLSTLLYLLPTQPYLGLMIAAIIGGMGGGLTEVLVSPIVEAIPDSNTVGNMSTLHAYFGWGYAGVVLFSTLYLIAFGTANWQWLPLLWAVLPLATTLLYLQVPINTLGQNRQSVKLLPLLRHKVVLLLLLTMISVGAAELAIAQWVSYFAEIGLQVSKTSGDLIGACGFASLMALGRMIYGKIGSRANLYPALIGSGIAALLGYLIIVFAPTALLSLIGCAFCGLAMATMWPAMFSLTAAVYPEGETAMFALLALAGDIGCMIGPGLVGIIAAAMHQAGDMSFWLMLGLQSAEIPLKIGLLVTAIFPVIVTLGVLWLKSYARKTARFSS